MSYYRSDNGYPDYNGTYIQNTMNNYAHQRWGGYPQQQWNGQYSQQWSAPSYTQQWSAPQTQQWSMPQVSVGQGYEPHQACDVQFPRGTDANNSCHEAVTHNHKNTVGARTGDSYGTSYNAKWQNNVCSADYSKNIMAEHTYHHQKVNEETVRHGNRKQDLVARYNNCVGSQ